MKPIKDRLVKIASVVLINYQSMSSTLVETKNIVGLNQCTGVTTPTTTTHLRSKNMKALARL